MARRRMNSGKFAENFAKSFSSTMSALARAKYYDSLIDKNKGLSPKDVAAWKGEEYFQKVIEQSRKAKGEATAKPSVGMAPQQAPTFVSRPGGAIPLR